MSLIAQAVAYQPTYVVRRGTACRFVGTPPQTRSGKTTIVASRGEFGQYASFLPLRKSLSLRDIMQSTQGRIPGNPYVYAALTRGAREALGVDSVEINGGENNIAVLQAHYNPFGPIKHLAVAFTGANGERLINFQTLCRGRNIFMHKLQTRKVIETFYAEKIRLGQNYFRVFDACNDIDNMYVPDFVKNRSDIIVQGGMCYSPYVQHDGRYSDEYYANFAVRLARAGFNSIGIKDMAGTLPPERAEGLFRAVREALNDAGFKYVTMVYHGHSTNLETCVPVTRIAIELGIGVELGEHPIGNGTGHPTVDSVNGDNPILEVNERKRKIFIKHGEGFFPAEKRKDRFVVNGQNLTHRILKILWEANVAGGAVPSIVNKLTQPVINQIKAKNRNFFLTGENGQWLSSKVLEDEAHCLLKAIELFAFEFDRVRQDAGSPCLVTPVQRIIDTQALYNVMYADDIKNKTRLEDRYKFINPDFVKLLFGYYGRMKLYKTADESNDGYATCKPDLLEFVKKGENNPFLKKVKVGKEEVWVPKSKNVPFHEPRKDSNDIEGALGLDPNSLDEAIVFAERVLEEYKGKGELHKVLSHSTKEQITLSYLARPYLDTDGETVRAYIEAENKRAKADVNQILALKKGPRVRELFPDIEYILKPVITQIGCMIAAGKELRLNPELEDPQHIEDIDPLDIKIADFGIIGEELFATYSEMPMVRNASENLRGLVRTSLEDFQNLSIKELLNNLMEMTGKTDPNETRATLDNLFNALNGYFDDLKEKFTEYREGR